MTQITQIDDDGVTPVERLKVEITEPQTVTVFSGSLEEVNRSLDEHYAERNRLEARITFFEAQKAQIEAELAKLPARLEPEPEPKEPTP